MIHNKTKIDGVLIIQPEAHIDNRGYFLETYNSVKYSDIITDINFVQDNESSSNKGVLRGLHYQHPPFDQSKLIKCTQGKILDVILDLRKGSNTFGETFKTILSSENRFQLFIPKGFAHGFLALSKKALVSYKVDNYYNPDFEDGVRWNDPDLNIDWSFNFSEIIISAKDQNLPLFKEINSPF